MPTTGHIAGEEVRLDEATARRLAVTADVDPRTIKRAAMGLPVKGSSGRRALAVVHAWRAEVAERRELRPANDANPFAGVLNLDLRAHAVGGR
ncbi:MAG: hypothetical protein HOW73_00750 [Polyangiaceae bacterium]|nr:hypothetical protein [Polyangiaceae bacterium]